MMRLIERFNTFRAEIPARYESLCAWVNGLFPEAPVHHSDPIDVVLKRCANDPAFFALDDPRYGKDYWGFGIWR